jgi:CHAT domain-containing protein/tetratricopeptide (TPR) repeat protein
MELLMLQMRLALAVALLGLVFFWPCPGHAQSRRGSQTPALDELNARLDEMLAHIDRLERGSSPRPGAGHFSHGADSRSDRLHSLEGRLRSATAIADGQKYITAAQNELKRLTGEKKYEQALPLARKLLAVSQKILGKENPATLLSANVLAALYISARRYEEAEPLLTHTCRVLERTRGRDAADTLNATRLLATLYAAQGRHDEAEPLLRRAVEVYERKYGKDHLNTLNRLYVMAAFYSAQGRFSQADAYFRRVLRGRERALGKDHQDVIAVVNAMATIQVALGRYDEAEPLFKRAIDSSERMLGKENPQTLEALRSLATLYLAELRFADADPLYRRVLEVRERVLGPEHTDTLTSMSDLAGVDSRAKRYNKAEALLRRVVETRERAQGKNHPDTLIAITELASLYKDQKRFDEAEPLLLRAVDAYERKDAPKFDMTKYANLFKVGELYVEEGRYAEAEPILTQAYQGLERLLGPEHPFTGMLRCTLAAPHFRQGDWARSLDVLRRCARVITRNALRGVMSANQALSGKNKSTGKIFNELFTTQIKAAQRLAAQSRPGDDSIAREMFETAQWSLNSDAARSLMQMAARGARGDPKLAALMRERQDLVAEWEMRDQMGSNALGKKAQERSSLQEAGNKARLSAIDARIAGIDAQLKREFPDYASLMSLAPVTVDEVQALLHDDEALALLLDTAEEKPTPAETFVWVVTKNGLRWTRAELGDKGLADEVQALRCGLDVSVWTGPRCAELTGSIYTTADADAHNPLPFDLERAHRLYKTLFGQSEDLIKGRRLLIVASGALTRLPFHVLVTAPPRANGDLQSAAWLARGHAVTVLPAVSSLNALRRVGRPSAASKPMIGFGNPLLEGVDSGHSVRAQMARERQSCPDDRPRTVATRGLTLASRQSGVASASHIRTQAPLPETVDELCSVARDLGADLEEVRLGARATESEVKKLSASGQLSEYRVIHFATHGATAGQISGATEPGLILTPPDKPTREDDGYLSASEIAGLRLDAEWVILSACNTAAGASEGAETLSGLSRAFMYAQARALLASHWSVDSSATVKLVTSAVREMSRDPAAGRAEALRRAMVGVIDNARSYEAHPSYWAPFVVVGEGAR